jgi:hypothetical protein
LCEFEVLLIGSSIHGFTFRAAAKAIQETNSCKHLGFRIRAEFSRRQQIVEDLPPPNLQFEPVEFFPRVKEEQAVVEELPNPPPIAVDLNPIHDGFTEKLSCFERRKVELSLGNKQMLEVCEKLAKKSEGIFEAVSPLADGFEPVLICFVPGSLQVQRRAFGVRWRTLLCL